MEGDTISMQEIFVFHQTGLSPETGVEGYFAATGVRPEFQKRLQTFGIRLPDEYFDPGRRFS
jgi:pilus assembly protein CpaF